MSVNTDIARDTVKTTVATFVMQAVAFLSSIIIAALFGANLRTDAYFLALSIPALYTAALFGALKAVFIPVFTTYKAEQPTEERAVLGSMYFVILLISILVFLFLEILAPLFVPFLAQGLDEEGRLLALTLTREILPLVVLSSLVGVLGSVYNAYQRFVIPILSPISRSLVLIFFVLLTQERLGVHSLSVGSVLGELAQVGVLLFAFKLKNMYLGIKFIVHPAFRRMVRLSLPPILGNVVLEINPLVDRIMIASTALGSITALNYATKLNDIPILLLSSGGFMTVVLSHWAKLQANEGIDEVRGSLEKTLPMLFFFLAPLLTIFYVLRLPLVTLIYQRKAFTTQDSEMTAVLWGILIFGVIPLILGRVLVRIFFLLQDTVTPFWIGIIRSGINISFNFYFKALFGLVGIAVSTSVTSIIMTLAILILVKRRLRELNFYKLGIKFSKILLSSCLIGIVTRLSFAGSLKILHFIDILSLRLMIAIGISSLLGVVFYLGLGTFFKLEEVAILKRVRSLIIPRV